MRFSTLPVLAAGLAVAAPLTERAGPYAVDFNAPPGGDVTILNYALTLEYLERKFYQEGLANYTQAEFIAAGFPDPFYANLKEIAFDEETHVAFLAGALGAAAVHEATYSFPSTTPASFVGLASVLEGVGVSAYLGAAAAIASKAYLTVAGSILTVESRHSSYIRASLTESPFPKPFDTPLDFNSVFSLAAEFITGFAAEDATLPFRAFPALTLDTSRYAFTAGVSPVTFAHAYKNAYGAGLINATTPVYAVFYSGLDVYYALTYRTEGDSDDLKVKIPARNTTSGLLPPSGQVYVVLSTADGVGNDTVSDSNVISGVGIVEVLA